MENFYHHIYVISYTDSLGGPVKIGYSNHPPTRLKQIQTGSPHKLTIYGSLSLKEEYIARLIEKIIASHLIDNNARAKGEWYNINVGFALNILDIFPLSRKNIQEPAKLDKQGQIENSINLIDYGIEKRIIDNDEFVILNEIFDSGDSEQYKYLDFRK